MESVFIYGGGNIAHSLAATISMYQPITVITRRPAEWGGRLAWIQNGNIGCGRYEVNSTSNIEEVSHADLIFIALPQFAIDEAIEKILSSIKRGATVAFVPAPARCEEYVKIFEPIGVNVVGMQRVPYIARILKYGQTVQISPPREFHRLAVSCVKLKEVWSERCRKWFAGDVKWVSAFSSFAFSNSNPLLHPSRLLPLLRDGENGRYASCPYFYAEWTNESSELYVTADAEMHRVWLAYSAVTAEMDYESVLDHYGVSTTQELTLKIRNIEGFKAIRAPWCKGEDGIWVPDFGCRYFTEDIPFGIKVIQSYARQMNVETPTIDRLIAYIDNRIGQARQIQQ